MALSTERRAERERNLIDAAHALIRETGDTGFSMRDLAARAGVSPATPYNLLGSKGEVLRRVVLDEFARFAARLATLPPAGPLDRLLCACDQVAGHYRAEPTFYRGLFAAVLGTRASSLRTIMTAEGRHLWSELIAAGIAAGEIAPLLSPDELTAHLLRTLSTTIEAWLAEDWDGDRFARELTVATRLLLLGLVPETRAAALRAAIASPP